MSFDDIVIYDRRAMTTKPSPIAASSVSHSNGDGVGGGNGTGVVDNTAGGIGNGDGIGGVTSTVASAGVGVGALEKAISLLIVTYGNGVATSLLAVDRFYAAHPGT